jgi:hypothetical protein
MKYFVPALLLSLALASGCRLLPSKHRKASAAAEVPPATGIEIEFHDRWIDRRIHELLTSGNAKTEQEAKAMAAAEFVKQYPYIHLPAAKSAK